VIEYVTTAGVFSLDGQDFDVENNIWLIGDDREVLVVDAAHDAAPIAGAVGDRPVRAILCTHGHNDHINAADDLSRATGGAPVLLHPDDEMLWDMVYPGRKPTAPCATATSSRSPGSACASCTRPVTAPVASMS
jgi:glyoxylase-like metal-dependent hydrolase (beta-lactamase superfamily II)